MLRSREVQGIVDFSQGEIVNARTTSASITPRIVAPIDALELGLVEGIVDDGVLRVPRSLSFRFSVINCLGQGESVIIDSFCAIRIRRSALSFNCIFERGV